MTANQTDNAHIPLFERYGLDDVRAMIEQFPLARVSGGTAPAVEASLLPLVGVFDDQGRLVELIGHLTRSNLLYHALQPDGAAMILFNGPSGYISPEHAGRRDWAPTWNYAQLKVTTRIRFDDALTDRALDLLIDVMERHRDRPWHAPELGTRYAGMRKRIIGFRAQVTQISGKFKMGQDENPETLTHILANHPDHELATCKQGLATAQAT